MLTGRDTQVLHFRIVVRVMGMGIVIAGRLALMAKG